jgi:hypothetical protein
MSVTHSQRSRLDWHCGKEPRALPQPNSATPAPGHDTISSGKLATVRHQPQKGIDWDDWQRFAEEVSKRSVKSAAKLTP